MSASGRWDLIRRLKVKGTAGTMKSPVNMKVDVENVQTEEAGF